MNLRALGEVLAAACVIAAFAVAITHPPQHPLPFGFLLAIMLVAYVGLSLVARLPLRVMNLPVKVTDENKARIQPIVQTMLAWQKACCVAVFAWIAILTVLPGGSWWEIGFLAALGAAPLVVLAIYTPIIRRLGGTGPIS